MREAGPIEPAADVLDDVDAFVAALVQHPTEGGGERLFITAQGLEIDQTHAFQSVGDIVLAVEDGVGGEA